MNFPTDHAEPVALPRQTADILLKASREAALHNQRNRERALQVDREFDSPDADVAIGHSDVVHGGEGATAQMPVGPSNNISDLISALRGTTSLAARQLPTSGRSNESYHQASSASAGSSSLMLPGSSLLGEQESDAVYESPVSSPPYSPPSWNPPHQSLHMGHAPTAAEDSFLFPPPSAVLQDLTLPELGPAAQPVRAAPLSAPFPRSVSDTAAAAHTSFSSPISGSPAQISSFHPARPSAPFTPGAVYPSSTSLTNRPTPPMASLPSDLADQRLRLPAARTQWRKSMSDNGRVMTSVPEVCGDSSSNGSMGGSCFMEASVSVSSTLQADVACGNTSHRSSSIAGSAPSAAVTDAAAAAAVVPTAPPAPMFPAKSLPAASMSLAEASSLLTTWLTSPPCGDATVEQVKQEILARLQGGAAVQHGRQGAAAPGAGDVQPAGAQGGAGITQGEWRQSMSVVASDGMTEGGPSVGMEEPSVGVSSLMGDSGGIFMGPAETLPLSPLSQAVEAVQGVGGSILGDEHPGVHAAQGSGGGDVAMGGRDAVNVMDGLLDEIVAAAASVELEGSSVPDAHADMDMSGDAF